MTDEYTEDFEMPEEGDDILDYDGGSSEPGESPSLESIALEMGWKPKDEFKGNDEDFVDAATYIRKSKDIQESMSKHLKENKRKLTSLEKGIEALKEHNDRVYKVQLEKQKEEIARLRKERTEAIEEGDVERVEAIEEKMTTLSENEPLKKDAKVDPEQLDAFGEWLKENAWYNVDGVTDGNKELTVYADKLADTPEYQVMPYALRIKKVAAKVKDMFPEHFNGGAKKKVVNPVEGAPMKTSGKKYSVRDLSDDQKSIMRNFVRNGIMTEQEYIADLAKIGELG